MKSNVLEVYYPYCIQKTEDGRYVVLNRRYKPLGQVTQEFIDYTPYAVSMAITPEVARRLSWKGADDIEQIHLYESRHTLLDQSEWIAYTDRLRYLGDKVVK